MIKPLRIYHYWYWRLSLILMPLMFIVVIGVRSNVDEGNYSMSEIKFDKFQVSDTTFQINIHIDPNLRFSSCLILGEKRVRKKILLGKIDDVGSYSIFVTNEIQSIVLSDTIRKTDLAIYRIK